MFMLYFSFTEEWIRYAPGIGPTNVISALVYVGFSFQYAKYVCSRPSQIIFLSDLWNSCLIERMVHGLDLGLTSHLCDVALLISLNYTQGLHPHWPRCQNYDPVGAPDGFQAKDLWYGRRAYYRWATDASFMFMK